MTEPALELSRPVSGRERALLGLQALLGVGLGALVAATARIARGEATVAEATREVVPAPWPERD